MDDTDARAALAGASRAAGAVRVVFHVVGQAVVDYVREVFHVESARRHVGSHEELRAVLAELLHREVALRLREIAVEGFGVVAVADQEVCDFLRFHAGAAKHDGIDARVVVHDTLECQILVAGVDEVVNMIDVLRPLVARADHDFLVIFEVTLGDALYFLAHSGGEEQRVALGGHAGKNGVDAFRETHVEHLVGLVEHHVFHGVELGHAALHKVDEPAGRCHDDLHTALKGADLRVERCAAVDGQHVQPLDVARIVFEVLADLEAQFAGRTENHGLRALVFGIYFLQNGQAVGSRFSRTGLRQGYDIVAFAKQIGDYFFLHGHRVFIAHFGDGAEQVFRDAEFFKCFQCEEFLERSPFPS